MELIAASESYCSAKNAYGPNLVHAGEQAVSMSYSAVIQSGPFCMNARVMACVAVKPAPAAPGTRFSQYAIRGRPAYALAGEFAEIPAACAARIICCAAVK